MPPEVLEFLGPFAAITTSCILGLVGLKVFLNYRRDVRIAQIRADSDKKLSEEVSMLREEVCFLRDGVEEANDRLEFHDRLLTRGAEESVSTPV